MNNQRIGMSLIVRDESDIISENIFYHSRHGVDAFAILDNGSTDGTYEILQGLQPSVDMLLFRDPDGFKKEERYMFLASVLKNQLSTSYVISNDADEFWVPKDHSLKGLISNSAKVQNVNRFNFLLGMVESARPDYRFYHSTNLVAHPLGIQPPAPDPATPLSIPAALRSMPGKIFCSLEGLNFISKGNHKVVHNSGSPCPTDAAVILHYPIRSFDQFKRKVINHAESLLQGPSRQSWHLRRWSAMLSQGRLREEYEQLTFDEAALSDLRLAGTIREERTLFDFFRFHPIISP